MGCSSPCPPLNPRRLLSSTSVNAMAASNGTIILPNPYTPMAFLPPDLATKVTNQTYATVGALAALLWDIILHLPQDYKLLIQFRINYLYINYWIARLTTLAFMFGLVIITTAPIDNCNSIRWVSILFACAIPLNSLLFVVRIFALYGNNKYIVAFFSLSWLCVLGSCIAVPIAVTGQNIGTTKYCLDSTTQAKGVNVPESFWPFIHDSLVFVATSWGFMRNSYSKVTVKSSIRVMVLGRELPALSRSILRDGQAYYLITLVLHLSFLLVSFITKPAPEITGCTVGIYHFVTLSNMSSHVYRNMRLGSYQDCSSITSSAINRALQGTSQRAQQHEIVFHNPVPMVSMNHPEENGGDLEAGHAREAVDT